jgi:cell division protein FtsB
MRTKKATPQAPPAPERTREQRYAHANNLTTAALAMFDVALVNLHKSSEEQDALTQEIEEEMTRMAELRDKSTQASHDASDLADRVRNLLF